MKCPLCNDPDAYEWVNRIIDGSVSIFDVARRYGCSVAQVQEHIDHHDPGSQMAEAAKQNIADITSPQYCLTRLMTNMMILESWLKYVAEMKSIQDSNIRTGVLLMREIRQTVHDVGEFQGLVGEVAAQNHMNDMNDKYRKLLNMALQELCPQCQRKLLQLME